MTTANTTTSAPDASIQAAGNWYVYIIESSDKRLYTGITTDMCRRWREHMGTAIKTTNDAKAAPKTKGAKFFRGRKPQCLRYLESQASRASASQREAAIKKLTRTAKLELLTQQAAIDWHQELNLIEP